MRSGQFRNCKSDEHHISFKDFENPFNFYALMFLPIQELMMDRNLLSLPCPKCGEECKLSSRKGKLETYSWHCRNTLEHEDKKDFEGSIYKHSFFDHSHFTFQDIFQFIYVFLQGHSLLQCSKLSGMHYNNTAVDWGNFVREIFKVYIHNLYESSFQLDGEIEIDESLFGHKCKFHHGNPQTGLKVWVFGMMKRARNKTLLFPVMRRTLKILLPLISKYIKAGSTDIQHRLSEKHIESDIDEDEDDVFESLNVSKEHEVHVSNECVSPSVCPIIGNNECHAVDNNVVELDKVGSGPSRVTGISNKSEINASLRNLVVSTTTSYSDTNSGKLAASINRKNDLILIMTPEKQDKTLSR